MGGVSFAAENTVPGDALYSVKINFNEKAVEALRFSDKTKAEWDTRLAERRLEEAEKLASTGNLATSTQEALQAALEGHTKNVREHIKNLKEHDRFGDAEDIASNLEAALRAHGRALGHLSQEDLNALDTLRSVEDEFNLMQDEHRDIERRFVGTSSPEVKSAAEGKLIAAQNKLNEVQKFFDARSGSLASTTVDAVNAKLKLVKDTIAQGKTKLNDGIYGEAFLLFAKAQRMAQEVKHLLDVRNELGNRLKDGNRFDEVFERQQGDSFNDEDSNMPRMGNLRPRGDGKGGEGGDFSPNGGPGMQMKIKDDDEGNGSGKNNSGDGEDMEVRVQNF